MPPPVAPEDIIAKLLELHMNHDVFGIIVACRDLRMGVNPQRVKEIDDLALKRMCSVLEATIRQPDIRTRLYRVLTEKDLPVDALLGPECDGWAGAGYKSIMYNLVRCKPLVYTFIAAMFKTHSLATYYAAAASSFEPRTGTGQPSLDLRFHVELAYLYLFSTDVTVAARLQETLYCNIEVQLEKLNAYFEAYREQTPVFEYPLDFVSPCQIMLGTIDESLKPRSCIPPTIMTAKTNELLTILVAGIPLILKHWDALHVRDHVALYYRIAKESSRLSPRTPMGLYIHLCFMTPTHLELCVDNLKTLSWSSY